MPYREDARIVTEAGVNQDIDRPAGRTGNRIAGGAITVDRLLYDIFQQLLGTDGFITKLCRRLPVNQFMAVAVTGDLVSLLLYAANQIRTSFGNPAQYEKCRVNAGIIKQLQYPVGVALNAPFARIPFTAVDRLRQRRHVKVVFHVDRHRIARLVLQRVHKPFLST